MNSVKTVAAKLSLSVLLPLCLAFLLAGCGGSGSSDPQQVTEPSTFSISGTITPATTSQVDGDTNDPNSRNIDNDTFQQAQLLPNPVVVGGFVSEAATGIVGDRFANAPDLQDWYRISLAQGQTVTLTISDHTGRVLSSPDIDLYLTTISDPFTPIQSSIGDGPVESIPVAVGGEYYLVVEAFGRASNYLLTVGQSIPVVSGETLRIEDEYVPGDLIVHFKDSPAESAAVNLQAVSRGQRRAMLLSLVETEQQGVSFRSLGMATGAQPGKMRSLTDPRLQLKHDTIRAVKNLRQRSDVVSADLNYIRQPLRIPADEFYSFQWHYPLINLPQAWDITTGDNAVVVAVVDTGVLMNHPDLNGRLCNSSDPCRGYDFISDVGIAADGNGIDPNPDDPGDGSIVGSSSFHGTHVAGTIGAKSNTPGSGSGVAGVTWNTKIMPLRVLGQGGGTSYDIMQSLLYAAGLPNDSLTVPAQTADIINLSLGGGGFSQAEQDVYDRLRDRGIVVVAAAGNDSTSLLRYPAAYNGVISVGAVDIQKNLAWYSNFGTHIDVVAPGGDTSVDTNGDGFGDGVLSTLGDDTGSDIQFGYDFSAGTSMAAPHVSGVVALMKAVFPGLTPIQLDSLLTGGELTEDLGGDGPDTRNDTFGYGLIDAHKAVLWANDLAGGATLPPSLGLFPATLNFGTGSTALEVVVSNVGGGSLTVTSVTEDAEWITSVTLTADDGQGVGLGTYRVTVDRSGLTDAIYSALISFHTSEGLYTLPVTMQVGSGISSGDAGYQWIILQDPESGETVDGTNASLNINDQYQYRFSNVPPGSYYVIAGTDSDNDGFICDPGEACGGFPLINNLSQISVGSANVTGIDFVTGFGTSLIEGSQVDLVSNPAGYAKHPGKKVEE